ncbi:hypothetical protein MMC25_005227 [Agyrium rufum]|nr:hypothetical protein [Agyrium rufum]
MVTKLPYSWYHILKKQYDALPSQRLLAFQSNYINQIGPNIKVSGLFIEGYFTTDPQNVEAVLSIHFEDWGLGTRREGLFPQLGEGIFTQDGIPWRHSREVLRRQFVRIQYQNLKVFDVHISHLIAKISSAKGDTIDLQPLFFEFTLATTTHLLFGEAIDYLEEATQAQFAETFDYASDVSAIRLRLAEFHWLYNTKRFRAACAAVKLYADQFVARALKDQKDNGTESASERYPFILDLYEELKDADLVRDQLIHVLMCVVPSSLQAFGDERVVLDETRLHAYYLGLCSFLLVRRPTALAKLRRQIESVVPAGHTISRAHLARIPYLRCVINETHRLYPQLPVNTRTALRRTTLPSGGGPDGKSPVLIRKGIGLVWSTYHMHRMTSLYGHDAEEFVPERWEGTDLEKKIGFGFLPFHEGPRRCLGKDFALSEASYAIVKVVQAFPNLRLPPHVTKERTGQERQTLGIAVSSAEGCQVAL